MKQNSIAKTTIVTIFVTLCLCAIAQPGLASCGDYLHTKHGMPENSVQLNQHQQNDHAFTNTAERSPSPVSVPPCRGPFCSNNDSPHSPFAPASLDLKIRAEAFCNFSQKQFEVSRPRLNLFEAQARQLTGFPGTIDHPPKAIC